MSGTKMTAAEPPVELNLAQAECLISLASDLGGAASIDKIVETVLHAFDRLWNWDACFFAVRKVGRAWYDIVAQYDTYDGQRKQVPPRRFEAAEYQGVGGLLKGEPVLVNRMQSGDGPRLRRFGDVERASASLMFANIQLGEYSLGLLSVQSYTQLQFSMSDLMLLQRVADLVAPAIQRCMSERRIAVLGELGLKLSSALTSEQAGQQILDTAQELLGWDACLVDFYDAATDTVQVVLNIDTVAGGAATLPPPERRLHPSPMMRRVLTEGGQLVLRDPDETASGEFQRYGDVQRRSLSILYVPVRAASGPIGVLSIQSYTPRAYDENDLATLQVLADHCGGALQRAVIQDALQHSEERFRGVVESLGEGLLLTDTEDVVQYVNCRFLEMSGYRQDELIGRSASEILLSADEQERMKGRIAERQQGMASRYEVELRHRNGGTFWVEVSGTPLFDGRGNVVGTIGAMTDITGRHRTAHEQSVMTELGLQLAAVRTVSEIGEIVETASLRLWNWDAFFLSLRSPDGRYQAVVATDTNVDGKRIHWPAGGENLAGLQDDHPIRRGEPLLINRSESEPGDLPRYGDVERPSRSLMFVGVRMGDEVGGVLSAQSYTADFFKESDLQLLQRIASVIGPTVGRCIAEEAFRRSEAELRLLVSSMSDIIVVYDKDCRYVKVAQTRSPRLEKLPEPLTGKTVYDVLPLHIAQRIHEYVRTCLATKRQLVLEYKAGKGSSEAWFSASLGPLTDETVVFVAHDITERMRTAKSRGVLAELGEKLSGSISPREAAVAVLHAADDLFTWDAAFLDAMEPDGRFRTLVDYDIMDGVRQEINTTRDAIPSENTRRTIEQGAQLILRKPEEDTSGLLPFGDPSRPSASLMFVPIRRGNRSTGVLSIQSYTPNIYTSEDLRMLQLLGDYCSNALHRTFSEAALRQSEERLRLLVSQMPVLVWTTDSELRLVAAMGTSFERLGISLRSAPGTSVSEYFAVTNDKSLAIDRHEQALAGHSSSFEVEWHGRHVNAFVEPLRNATGDIIGTIGVAHDVTERKNVEMKLHHGAFHDALTDLPNRALFMNWLSRALAHAQRRPNYKFAVLFLDLDRFKNINDSLGHSFGDRLLVLVAERLRACLRTDDMVSRIGGDEFAVFLDEIEDVNQAVTVAQKILGELSRPFSVDSHDVFTGTSIGIAVSSTGYEKPDDLLRDADAAMYRAKSAGKGRYEIFDAAMHARVMSLMKLESDMRRAIEREEFELYYQPIVSLRTGNIAGFEALLRWNHPERGPLPPTEFVPLAEETGLIVPIGLWSLRKACAQMHLWQARGTVASGATISVNVSARQFQDEGLVLAVKSVLEQTGLSPGSLKLEITESTLMHNAESSTVMLNQLRALNVQLHIDDFGTGYSSLAYLNQFPIDALKIDKSFVSGLGVGEESLEIVRTIVTMAQTLGMDAVAEGIETTEQLLQLKALGCKYGQGFYFAAPQMADRAEHLLHEQWRMG
jgi:diguanylate cyclase (GGDEF)-like protein/PAS domain S-box-containing protein